MFKGLSLGVDEGHTVRAPVFLRCCFTLEAGLNFRSFQPNVPAEKLPKHSAIGGEAKLGIMDYGRAIVGAIVDMG
jgi:hypothetical protein